MKKRTIIAIIITIAAIIATNKYWFIINPLPVSFDIDGCGKCNIEVLLNRKDNSEFIKVKRESIQANLDEKKHIDVYVSEARFPKRIKITLFELSSTKPVTIRNIQFTNGKYTLDHIDKFKVSGAKVINKDNSLILLPNSDGTNVITLIYPDTLHIRPKMDFDFMVFSIILILVYLLAYKLSNYVAEFSTLKGKSRVEVIFLAIFFILLFLPILHINQDDISQEENRTLAKWKPIIADDNTINFEFGKNFNEWFNDRFNLREFFFYTNDLKLILSRNWITKNVVKGSNNWLFLGWKESRDSYTNSIMFTDDELASIDNYLSSINNYCLTHNKKFYFFIAPDKSKIYPEYYPQSIKRISDTSRSMQLIDYINKHSKVKVIYPKDRLISEKGDNLLYWKNDTHWNLLGAYYGYSELMNAIKKDYPNISIYKIKGYLTEQHTGDLYNMAPKILRKTDDTVYTVPDADESELCKQPRDTIGDVVCSSTNSDKNLLMFRDSFSISLIPYLAHTFGNSKYIWKFEVNPNVMKNADIIILEIVERNLPALVNKHMEAQ